MHAQTVLDSLEKAQAFVPSLWPLEVTNALLVAERRKRSSQADTTAWIRFLQALPIRVDEETTQRAWSEALALARSRNLSLYDASYLELALRRGIPLATLDDRLKASAADAGIPGYEP